VPKVVQVHKVELQVHKEIQVLRVHKVSKELKVPIPVLKEP